MNDKITLTAFGKGINPAYMPWPEYGRMTVDDLEAIVLYLQSLPPTVAEE